MVKSYIFALVVLLHCGVAVGMELWREDAASGVCLELDVKKQRKRERELAKIARQLACSEPTSGLKPMPLLGVEFMPPLGFDTRNETKEERCDSTPLTDIMECLDPKGALQKCRIIRSDWQYGLQNRCPISWCKVDDHPDIAEHIEREHLHFFPSDYQAEVMAECAAMGCLPVQCTEEEWSRRPNDIEAEIAADKKRKKTQKAAKKAPLPVQRNVANLLPAVVVGKRKRIAKPEVVNLAQRNMANQLPCLDGAAAETAFCVAGKRKREEEKPVVRVKREPLENVLIYLQNTCPEQLREQWRTQVFSKESLFSSTQCPIEGCPSVFKSAMRLNVKSARRLNVYNHLVCTKHKKLFPDRRHKENHSKKKKSIGENSYSSDL